MPLQFKPALDRPDLLAQTVKKCLETWKGSTPVQKIFVTEIDPQFMGGAELCAHYGIAPTDGANCVVVEAIRGPKKTFAACLVPVNCTRTDFNGAVRKHLGARRVSVAPLEEVLKQTGMEYGSITAVGLPESWQILIDPSVATTERIIIGSGLQKSKLSLPGKALLELPNAHLLTGLCMQTV
ncbi:MAG: hypothetical protein HY461_03040 [Parcubacteria group bacterium]|nr:hypothetical protein [Parcubacteria group bacterium]